LRKSGEFFGKRSGIFSEGGLEFRRLRLREWHHQSDRKRKRSVLSQNLLHVKLLYVNLNNSYCSQRRMQVSTRRFNSLSMVLLTEQYVAKNQCLQEK
jgi:hypothetical protein